MIWVVLGLFMLLTFGQAIWNDVVCGRRERMDFAAVASEPMMSDRPGEAPVDYDG